MVDARTTPPNRDDEDPNRGNNFMTPSSVSPEYIEKLQKLKDEFESMTRELKNMAGKSAFEIEGRIREFQDKENEIKKFLRERVLN